MDTLFLTTLSPTTLPAVRLLIDSLRTFGGPLAQASFWVFAPELEAHAPILGQVEDEHTHLLPLNVPTALVNYPFGEKVAACAQAEQLAPPETRTLVWLDACCLIVQPPVLFDLGAALDGAFRPVHLRNVGLPPSDPLDPFWQGIYAAVGMNDSAALVTSFVDGLRLRAYFNSHAFAIRPALGMMQRWSTLFQQLVGQESFQTTACSDERHQIFLFQALLSALVASTLEPARLRLLPPSYNYPYNLQARVPVDRRAHTLNELVCLTYEDRSVHSPTDIQVNEPLRSWLNAR